MLKCSPCQWEEKGIYLHVEGMGPPAVSYFPVRAAVFHSRYPLFWVMSEPFLLKLLRQPLRHHHVDAKLLLFC